MLISTPSGALFCERLQTHVEDLKISKENARLRALGSVSVPFLSIVKGFIGENVYNNFGYFKL